jgi:hypothetical protein
MKPIQFHALADLHPAAARSAAAQLRVFFLNRKNRKERTMTTDDLFNVCIDAPTVALVDAWAHRSAF